MSGYIADCIQGHRGFFITVSLGEDICGTCGMSGQMYRQEYQVMLIVNADLEIELESKEILIEKLEEEISHA